MRNNKQHFNSTSARQIKTDNDLKDECAASIRRRSEEKYVSPVRIIQQQELDKNTEDVQLLTSRSDIEKSVIPVFERKTNKKPP